MKSRDPRSEWEKQRAGRLHEGEGEAKILLGGTSSRSKSLVKPGFELLAPRSTILAGAVAQRIRPITTYRLQGSTPVGCFHMRLGSVSRRPRKGKHASNRQIVGSAARAIRRARDFQNYVERAGPYADQFDHVESDEHGPILEGNLGKTTLERLDFWKRVDEFETRKNARIQFRIDAELPHWLSPKERRTIVTKFGQFFETRDLFWFAAVHRPPNEGDQRNHHLHVVFHDRPRATKETGDIDFATKKNRSFQGRDWVQALRKDYARICTDVILRSAAEQRIDPPRIYFPGSYADLGIVRSPQKHLGPGRVAGIRGGRVTVPLADTTIDGPRPRRQNERQLSNLILDIKLIKKIFSERHLIETCERHKLHQAETQRLRSELHRSLSTVAEILQLLSNAGASRDEMARLTSQLTADVAALFSAQDDLIGTIIANDTTNDARNVAKRNDRVDDVPKLPRLPEAAKPMPTVRPTAAPISQTPAPQELPTNPKPREPSRPLAVDRGDTREVGFAIVRLRALSWENLLELFKTTKDEFEGIPVEERKSRFSYLQKLLAGQRLIYDEVLRRNAERNVARNQHAATARRRQDFER